MSNGADQNGKAGGWRRGRIAAVVGVLGLGGWLIWSQTDLSLADFCTLLTYVGHKDQVAACTASNGGFYLGAGLLLVLIGLGWLVLTKYKAASEGFALMASHILGFVKYSTPEEPSPAPIAADRESDLKFLKELADEGSLSPEQAEHFQQLKSALADQALTRLRAEAGPSESEADAQADTAMTEAVEEAVEQGSDAQIEALRFIGAGDIPSGLDRLAAAAETATTNAVALWRQVGEIAYPVDTRRARNAYERVIALGSVDPRDYIYLSRLHRRAGDLLRSSEVAEAGLAGTDTSNSRELSILHNEIAENLVDQGNLAEALDRFELIHEIMAERATVEPNDSRRRRDLSISLDRIGDVLVAKGDLDAALKRFQESLEIREVLARNDPGNAGWRRDLSVSLNKIGDVLVAKGDLDAALKRFQESLEIREALARDDPGNAGWRRDLSVSLDRIGNVLVAKGDLDGALKRFQESLEIREALARDDPGNAGWRRDLAFNHAKIALAGGDPRAHWGEAVAILEALAAEGRLAPRDHGSLETARARLAALVDGPGDNDG
ncbi:MAG: tetratricopeptide repeat protein [Alphaproteobacteria bacterium]|nr:tetratricopeptide repeat protein [Alphaproteobacteria bacterium]